MSEGYNIKEVLARYDVSPLPAKKKRIRNKKVLAPLTEEEWNALPERPKLYIDGKLVEMTFDQQHRYKR
jgi:hypothetical protein